MSAGPGRLNGRAGRIAIGAEHAAVARLRFEAHTAAAALIEKSACVRRHRFFFGGAATRTGNHGLQDHCVPLRHQPYPAVPPESGALIAYEAHRDSPDYVWKIVPASAAVKEVPMTIARSSLDRMVASPAHFRPRVEELAGAAGQGTKRAPVWRFRRKHHSLPRVRHADF